LTSHRLAAGSGLPHQPGRFGRLRESLGTVKVGLLPHNLQILLHSSYTVENDLFLSNEIKWMKTHGHFAGMSGDLFG
jgi:hypothetical protein